MFRYFILSLSLLIAPALTAQLLTKRVFGVEDGLQQIETKGVFSTSEGRLYVMQTDGSCTLFDGYAFYPVPDNFGLPRAEVTQHLTTKDWTLLTVTGSRTFTGNYFRPRGGIFRNVPINPSNKKSGKFVRNDSLFFYNTDSIFLYRPEANTLVFFNTLPEPIRGKSPPGNNFLYRTTQNDSDIIFFRDELYLRQPDGSLLLSDNYEPAIPDYQRTLRNLLDYGIDTANISTLHLAHSFSEYPCTPFAPYLWHPLHWQGKHHYLIFDQKDKSLLGRTPLGMSKYMITAVHPGTHWASSHQGLHRVQNYIKYYPSGSSGLPPALHSVVQDQAGNILVGGYSTGWARLERDSFIHIEATREYPRILPRAFPAPDGRGILYFAEEGLYSMYRLHDNKVQGYYPTVSSEVPKWAGRHPNGRFTGYFIDTLHTGKIAFGGSRLGLGIIERMEGDSIKVLFKGKEKGMDLVNVLHYTEDTAHRIWMGRASRGIALYDSVKDTIRTWVRNSEVHGSFGSMSAHTDVRGNIWFGGHDGLYFLENPTSVSIETDDFFARTRRLDLPNGLRTDVSSLTQVDSFLVFGTSHSINFLNLPRFYRSPSDPLIYQLLFGEDIEGGGAEQNALLFDRQRRLWVGCQEGLLEIDLDRLIFDTTTNKILLRTVQAGDDTLTVSDNTLTLPVDNRNCSIHFGPELNHSMLKNIFFDYYLLSPAGDTLQAVRYNQDGIFRHAAFTPGDYRLVIEARKHGQLTDRRDVRIRVPRTLSENPWFWVILVGLLLAGLTAFLLFRQKQQRLLAAKELALSRSENEKNNLQIQAIISSFNPHFINNSLHWVQSRHNRDESMVRLIGRLSENIGIIFDNTRKGKAYHSIEEELLIVRNYIEIQKIRFRNSFNYEEILPEDENVLRHNVLLMHLQIHVENAVEHGLRNREAASYVKVRITEIKKEIIITIEDDGCGREYAQKVNSQGTQTGTKMVSGLMKIFNSANRKKISQSYEDNIFSDAKGSYGTRVTLRYPKKMSFEVFNTL